MLPLEVRGTTTRYFLGLIMAYSARHVIAPPSTIAFKSLVLREALGGKIEDVSRLSTMVSPVVELIQAYAKFSNQRKPM